MPRLVACRYTATRGKVLCVGNMYFGTCVFLLTLNSSNICPHSMAFFMSLTFIYTGENLIETQGLIYKRPVQGRKQQNTKLQTEIISPVVGYVF